MALTLEMNIVATLTKRQHQILTGLLLGDGSLYRRQSKTKLSDAKLSLSRKAEDHEYNLFLYDAFRRFCSSPPNFKNCYDKRHDKHYVQSFLNTRNAPAFNEHHAMWYGEQKILPLNFRAKDLTPLTCAIWFCDDGCVFRANKKANRLALKLATHGFSFDENRCLADLLRSKFGEYYYIAHDDGNYFIGSADAGCKAFIRHMTPELPSSMSRKVTWTEEQMLQKKSFAQLRNRDKFDFNEKETSIMQLMQKGDPLSPAAIAAAIRWMRDGKTPSGLHLYLKRFLGYGWLSKSGTLHSYKDVIKYTITEEGRQVPV